MFLFIIWRAYNTPSPYLKKKKNHNNYKKHIYSLTIKNMGKACKNKRNREKMTYKEI